MSDNEDLEIKIGSDPSGVESGSRAASAAINKVQQEASSLDRAFRALKGSIDPMFAAQDRYNKALEQSERLLAAGRISETEYKASVDAATQALARQAAEQLRGTAVAQRAAAAVKAASDTKAAAEAAAANISMTSQRAAFAAQEAAEAKLTATAAAEAKNRAQIAVNEAKGKYEAAVAAAASVPNVNRNAAGKFVSKEAVQAERDALAAEAAAELQAAQLDATAAAQKSRNAQRVAATREEAARRAALAEQAAQAVAIQTAQEATDAAAVAAAAQAELATAQEVAAAAAIKSAEAQLAADEAVAAATEAKAKAAVEAALAEEKEAKATAEAAKADAAKAAAAKKLEAAERAAAKAEAERVAAANRIKAALDPAYAAQLNYNKSVQMANSLFSSGHIDEATKLKAEAAAQKELESALKGATNTAKLHREAYEGLVLVHEALEHRFTRMIPSAMILGQAMAGNAGTASVLGAIMSPLGLTIIGVTAALGAMAFAAFQGSEAFGHLQQALAVTSNYAGMSASQIGAAAKKIAENTNTAVGDAEKNLAALAGTGRVSGETMLMMGDIVQRVTAMTHQKSEEVVNALVKMAKDPAKAVAELNEQYHFLSPTQAQHIRDLVEQGDKLGAVTEATRLWDEKLKEEQTELSGFAGFIHGVSVEISGLIQKFRDLGKGEDAAEKVARLSKELNNLQHPGVSLPDNEAIAKKQQELAKAKQDLDKETTRSHKAQLDQQATDDRDALDKLETSTRTNHEKMLREQAAWRKEAHRLLENPEASAEDKRDAQFRLDHAKETDARIAKKFDAGDTSTDKGPGQVALWSEQLHKMEIASKDFFKDQTDDELKFWQAKLLLTKQGSKEWVEVQTKIYDLQKKEAKSNYDDDIAALKEKIEAAKGDLGAEQAAWDAYLTKVKTVMGATSKEYKDAEKDYIKAQAEMASFAAKQLASKEKVAEGAVTRQEGERTTALQSQKATTSFEKSSGALTDLQAAQQNRAILDQEIADERQFENTIFQMKLEELNKELALPGMAKEKIAEIHNQIEQLTQTHEDKLAAIRNKALLDYQKSNQEVATAVQQKWLQTTDSFTSALGSTFKQGIAQGFNFKAGIRSIADSIVNTWVDMGIKNLNTWIKSLLMQKTAQRAASAAQVAVHTSTEAAKTAATITGVTSRTAAENTGFFSKIFGLLASMLGIHIATEGAKTTATTVGAIARAGASKAEAAAAISSASSIAGANGVASMALAPFPLDLTAPAFGASMAAAAAAFGTVGVAAKGWGEVPADGTPALLHKKEMVLPAQFAVPLRKMLTTRDSSGMRSAVAQQGNSVRNTTNNRGGDNNFYFQPKHEHKSMDLMEALKEQGGDFRRWLRNEARNGNLKFG